MRILCQRHTGFCKSSTTLLRAFPFILVLSLHGAVSQAQVKDVFVDWDNIRKWDESSGDTWDPFWADDDNLYAFNDDGRGFGKESRNLAFNRLEGNSVTGLVGYLVNPMAEYGKGGQKGKDKATWKACGSECIDGIFYCFVSRHVYGKDSKDPELRQTTFNASLIKSTDKGMTWTRSADENYRHPMWKGAKFSAPYFFHYGKNGGNFAQDDSGRYVYAVSPNGFWNNGNDLIVGRVQRGKLPQLKAADWEYHAGADSWTSDINKAVPVIEMKSKCSMTGPSYVPGLKAYLMVVWYNTDIPKKWYYPAEIKYDFYQAEHPWGPWSIAGSVSDRQIKGGHMYGTSICAKFQERVGPDVKVWLFHSGFPFDDKPESLYKMWAIPLILSHSSPSQAVFVGISDQAVRRNGTIIEYDFDGTGIDCVAEKARGNGSADIYIDGILRKTVNLGLNNFPAVMQVTLFQWRGLPDGRHTIKLTGKADGALNWEGFRIFGLKK